MGASSSLVRQRRDWARLDFRPIGETIAPEKSRWHDEIPNCYMGKCGLSVAGFWALYFFATFPSANERLRDVRILVDLSCPVAMAGWHYPIVLRALWPMRYVCPDRPDPGKHASQLVTRDNSELPSTSRARRLFRSRDCRTSEALAPTWLVRVSWSPACLEPESTDDRKSRNQRTGKHRLEHQFESDSNLAAGFVLLLAFLLRLWKASGTFLNPDEAMHFLAANKPSLAEAYRASLNLAHPPLLILLLNLWRRLGTSELFLRLPSVDCRHDFLLDILPLADPASGSCRGMGRVHSGEPASGVR